MKPKNFSKKLILNKKTVADLNNKEMKEVVGGFPNTPPCFTFSYWPIACKACF